MKKSKLFLLGMAAMALTFGLILAGCGDGADGGDDGGGGTPAPTATTFKVIIKNDANPNPVFKPEENSVITQYRTMVTDDTTVGGPKYGDWTPLTVAVGETSPELGPFTT
jgi:hypothetical protein